MRRRDPRGLAGGESGAHDAQRGPRHPIAVGGPAGGEQVRDVAAHERPQRDVVGLASGLLETAAERRRIVKFARPGAERDAIGKPRPAAQILGGDLIERIDVPRLAGAEFGAGRDQIRVPVARDAADHIEIGPGLAASAHLRGADAGRVPGVVFLGDQIGDDVSRDRQPHHEPGLFGEVRNAPRLRLPDRLAPARGRDRHLARDAAEPGAERAHVDEASIAVTRRGAGEIHKVAVPTGVDEGARLDPARPAAILDRDGAHGIAVALRGNEEGMQQHIDARF